MWSNFELPKAQDVYKGETSTNYLAIDVLERSGLPLPAYQSFLKEVREQYPVITANQIRDAQGQLFEEGSEEVNATEEQVKDAYQTMQYYLMFDLDK